MKKSNILKASLLMGVVIAVSSCREETINYLDPTAVPQASDYSIKVDVDPSTNQVTLNLVDAGGAVAKGVYPVWKVYTKSNPVLSTRPTYTDIVAIAGDYDVEAQVANRNGVSDGVLTGTIHIENTMMDFSPYVKSLTGGSSKVWHIDGSQQGNLGCGEPGTDGLNWWSAAPNDKAAFGVYDNLMTFTDNGGDGSGLYTFDPGTPGTIYVNKDVTVEPYSASNPHNDEDFCAPAELQENVPFTLTFEGADLVLKFPEGTLIGYLPNDDLYYDPKFKVLNLNANQIELVCDNGGIAWHYLLAPVEEKFEGFKYDSEFNMWKNAEVFLQSTWFSPSDWSGSCVQPEVDVTNSTIKFHTPADMGGDQWMGQVHIGTNIAVSAGETYDFSCVINAPEDIVATVKVQMDGNDDVSFAGQDQIAFTAGGSCYYFSDKPGFDGTLKIAFDFGGNPDMDIIISKIVFKNHKDDDGTVLPSDEPAGEDPVEEDVSWVSPDSADNIWNSATITNTTFYTAMGGDWSSIANPDLTEGDNEFTLVYSEGSGDQQWQAQFGLETNLSFSADKKYDFSVTINPSCDLAGVTVKPTNFSDDSFWSDGRHDVSAGKDNVIRLIGVSAEMPDFKIVFDLPGVEVGGTVVIKNIIIQEHTEFGWVEPDSDANIWNSGTVTLVDSWTSGEDWNGTTAEPQINEEGNGYSLYYSETPGTDQWKAQFKLETNLSFPGDKAYDFRVTIVPTCDIPQATVKPTNFTDDIFWSEGRHDLTANEENVIQLKNVMADMPDFKIVFDFAGVREGASVVVKDIIIQEHQ